MQRFFHLGLATLLASFVTMIDTFAADLASTRPERVGVSSERLKKIDTFAQRYVDNKQYAGIVTLVARDGKIVHQTARGQYGLDNDKPMDMDALFRIYSMTKPITVAAALMLYEDGRFHMNDPVAKYLPEFENQQLLKGGELVKPASKMTMAQLFTHTAGLTYGTTLDNPVDEMYAEKKLLRSANSNEFIATLATIPLRFEPGTRYHYSVATDVLGAVVERLSGQSLAAYFDANIFKPLGMKDTFFAVPPDKRHRLTSIHYWDTENNALAIIPDDKLQDFEHVTFFSGGGGLVSTARDYMRFCQMILNGGSYNGNRLLGPKTIEYMSQDHLTPQLRAVGRGEYPSADFYPGQSKAMGYGVITNPALTPSIASKGELSWGGVGGTKFWIDPVEKVIGIAMVQLYGSPHPLRFDFKVATYQALTELNEL